LKTGTTMTTLVGSLAISAIATLRDRTAVYAERVQRR